MSFGSKRGIMWAGVFEGHIATDTDKSIDVYTPMTIALFPTEAAAKERYERVVDVDVDKLLRVGK